MQSVSKQVKDSKDTWLQMGLLWAYRELWAASAGRLGSGFWTPTGLDVGVIYSVSSSLSPCSPGGSFGTGRGLEEFFEEKLSWKTFKYEIDLELKQLNLTEQNK